MTEERKEEGQESPEVEAAWQKLLERSEILREAIEGRDRLAVKSDARQFQRWFDILEAKDSVVAFREEMRQDLAPWLDLAETAVSEGNLSEAIDFIRGAERDLIGYAALLGQEVPPREPEEGVPAAPSAAEEVEPVEGTPLRELGLSMRVHGYLARGLKGELGRWPLVEDIVRILSEKGEKGLRAIRGVGPKALEEILAALKVNMEP